MSEENTNRLVEYHDDQGPSPVPPTPAPYKMELGDGNYAIKHQGLIEVFLNDGRQIFGIDDNTFAFEKKPLAALLQVFMAGVRAGAKGEKEQTKMKLAQLVKIVFE